MAGDLVSEAAPPPSVMAGDFVSEAAPPPSVMADDLVSEAAPYPSVMAGEGRPSTTARRTESRGWPPCGGHDNEDSAHDTEGGGHDTEAGGHDTEGGGHNTETAAMTRRALRRDRADPAAAQPQPRGRPPSDALVRSSDRSTGLSSFPGW